MKTAAECTAAIKLKKIKTFAFHFSFAFIVFAHENNCIYVNYVLRFFSPREICRKLTGQNISGSFLTGN